MSTRKSARRTAPWIAALASVALVAISACGGGGGSSAPAPLPPSTPAQLVTVSIAPGHIAIPLGLTQQYVATGTYSDASSRDVTALASWSTANAAVARVDDQASKGLASSVAIGSAAITARLNGIDATVQLTIDAAALVSIELLRASNVTPPATGSLAVDARLHFTAAGRYTNNTVQDLTNTVVWGALDSAVAVLSNTPGEKGSATGIAAGTTRVEATLGAIKGTANITVLPIKTLEFETPNTKAAGLGGVALDDAGNAMTVWHNQFSGGGFGTPPQLYARAYTLGGGWAARVAIDFGAIDDFPALPALAMNASGVALLAWAGHGGVYASHYSPGGGWQQARVIASGPTPFLTFAESLRLAIDASGNGLLVWTNDQGNRIFSSQYTQASDSWTAPGELQNVDRGLARSALSLALNAVGTGVLVWENWTFNAMPGWNAYASLFIPGSGQGSGWQTPQALHASESGQTPVAAIDASAQVHVAFVDYTTAFPSTSLYSRRYLPNQGWQALEGIAVNDASGPTDPVLAINAAGAAVVVWRNSYDKAVWASRHAASGGWQAAENVWPTGVGDPTVLRPHIAADGRILAAWVSEDLTTPFKVGLRRYVPGSGWEPAQGLPYIEHKGSLAGIALAFNPSGNGVALWGEAQFVFDGQFFNSFSDFYANTLLTY
jgi:hypothetical protein